MDESISQSIHTIINSNEIALNSSQSLDINQLIDNNIDFNQNKSQLIENICAEESNDSSDGELLNDEEEDEEEEDMDESKDESIDSDSDIPIDDIDHMLEEGLQTYQLTNSHNKDHKNNNNNNNSNRRKRKFDEIKLNPPHEERKKIVLKSKLVLILIF
jgi:hypothetical protein